MSDVSIKAPNSVPTQVVTPEARPAHDWRRFGRNRITPMPMASFQCVLCRRFMCIADDKMEAADILMPGRCGEPVGLYETWRATVDGRTFDGQIVNLEPPYHFHVKDSATGDVIRVPWGIPDETPPAELVTELREEAR
jgi:hypothetical protein